MKARQRQRIEASRQRLTDLGYANYRAYLQGDHWADVRKRFWASKLPKTCGGCGASRGLHLHHRTYKRIGAEWLTDLILVCGDCHSLIHKFEHETGAHPWGATKGVLRRKRKEMRSG